MNLFRSLIPQSEAGVATATREASAAPRGPVEKPAFNVRETEDAFALTVYLPGVAKEGLEMTAAEGELTIAGRRSWTPPAGWSALYRETGTADYELVLSHENAIDLDAIKAELTDGVLRAVLPKAAALKPRKIAIA